MMSYDDDVCIHEYIMVEGGAGMDICWIVRGVVVLILYTAKKRNERETYEIYIWR